MNNKPRMLMLSHCLPAATGNAQRARAWQLLKQSALVFDVSLVCLCDGPISLAQWRAVQCLTSRLSIEQASLWQYLADRRARVIEPTIIAWQQSTRFDTVLFNHPALWASAANCDVKCRIGDLNPAVAGSGKTALRDNQLADLAAHVSNVVLIDRRHPTRLGKQKGCQAVVTPLLIDLDACAQQQPFAAAQSAPAVAVLGQSQRAVRKLRRRLRRSKLDVKFQSDTVGATAAIVADGDVWRAFDTMARSIALITTTETADRLAARHGSHLLHADNVDAMVAHCADLLTIPPLRRSIALAGRQFVESRHQLTAEIAPWTTLWSSPSANLAFARAA